MDFDYEAVEAFDASSIGIVVVSTCPGLAGFVGLAGLVGLAGFVGLAGCVGFPAVVVNLAFVVENSGGMVLD